MDIFLSILKLSAGVGLFLFAMYLIEDALKNLSGRTFKIFLQKITKSSLRAAIGGAIITAILQSSSVVSFMVLAFVGAGIFSLKNALAIILGANIGTTLASWMVATLGFKMNIEILAYPSVFIGGFVLILFDNRKYLKNLALFLLGFGLLFIALSFMKTAMEANTFDFSKYRNLPTIVYLLIGFIITFIVQSSSVTMALTLSALNADTITFLPAAAIVLGSETGTSIKIMVGAIGGNASKKQVALGNFLFNIFSTVLAFIFIKQIIGLISNTFNIKDPLIGLVSFSSFVNVVGVIIFLPFLNLFVKLFMKMYKNVEDSASTYISYASIKETVTALDLFRRETAFFIHNAMVFIFELFELNYESLKTNPDFIKINEKKGYFSKTPDEKYNYLKQLQGELQVFYLKLRSLLKGEQVSMLNQLISALRSAMHSVKSIKDVERNISNLSQSSKNIKFDFFLHHKKETEILYQKLNKLLAEWNEEGFEELNRIFIVTQKNYTSALENFYKDAQNANTDVLDITTALNFNREIFTSNKAMLVAVKDYLLSEKDSDKFNELLKYRT